MRRLLIRLLSGLALSIFAITFSGCGIVKCKLCSLDEYESGRGSGVADRTQYSQIVRSPQSIQRSEPVIITATGYGAPDTQIKNKPQQVLMAMRASEVDAYRTLAERVKGVQISATTKVSDFLTNYDHLRAVVDSFIQQARIASQGLTDQGYYETTLSLTLDQSFFQQFTSAPPPMSSSVIEGLASMHEGRAVTLSTFASHYDTGGSQRWLKSE